MPTAPLPADDSRRAALLNEPDVPGAAAETTTDDLIARARHLEAQHDRMADFARASGDWMWEVDADLRLIWLSGSFAMATGLEAARLLGHSLAEVPMLDLDGLDLPGQTLGMLLRRKAAFSRVISPLVTPTGMLKVSNSAVPVRDATGQFAGFRGTARDVTAQLDARALMRAQAELLRRSEERWEMAAAATGIGIAELDLTSGLMLFDRRACINHGLVFPATGYRLNDWLAAIHSEDSAAARAAVQDAIDRCGRLEARYRLQRREGEERVLEIVANVAPHTGRLVGTCRDVTQQVALEQLLRDKESAVRANQAKSQFLSRVSHELRTPLNGILGFAQLMALDRVNPLAPDQQRRLDSVHRSGRHLLGLINDMLDLARIEQEDFSLHVEPVDLRTALSTCLLMIASLAQEAGVALPPAPTEAFWVQADRQALEQVLVNLLSNAVKYNRRGGHVGVALQMHAGFVQVAISDEGPGIGPEQQARLFNHFDRLGAETGPVEGVGLGLVISRQLAHAMGADLRVQSRPGAGSTFSVVLPVVPAPLEAERVAAPVVPLQDLPGPPRNVLYVEDERLNVVLMEEVFRTRPAWTLHIAEDGAEGLQIARSLRPHLLLIDMNLPDTNGLALIRRLRDDPATRPLHCIALSADAMHEQIEAALAAGFDEYWTKPIDVPRVLAELARHLA